VREPRPTDTLANERTFLAYERTALAFVGFGFVIARFSLFTREFSALVHIRATSPVISTLFGTVMALAGVACAGYGAYRYIATARALRAGSTASMPDSAAIVIAAIIASIGLIATWTFFAFR
jgi:putative membrane protein